MLRINNNNNNQFGWLHLINAILSVFVLTALLVDALYELPPEEHNLIIMLDHAICAFFLAEFIRDFYRAPNKLKFMKWGWIDLLSSIPNLEIFREGRLIRIIRIIRIFRAFKDTAQLIQYLFANKAKGTFGSALIFAIMAWIFASIAILIVEQHPDSNIKTAGDALWWGYVTITTVGYGDRFPVTPEGRIIAAALMTVGVGLFGTLTGYLASMFVGKSDAENAALIDEKFSEMKEDLEEERKEDKRALEAELMEQNEQKAGAAPLK